MSAAAGHGFLLLGTGVGRQLSMDFAQQSNQTDQPSISKLNLVTYEYIMPLTALVGFTGNLFNLVVLSSKELKTTSRGQKVSQRSKSMFSYMKALAITDLLYLMMTFQGCYFTIKGYFRSTNPVDMPTKGMGMYVWNYMSPFWNAFAASSDLIVVVMTTVRFQILNNVDQRGVIITGSDTKPKWLILWAIVSGLVMHIPYNFQFMIIPCEEESKNYFLLDCWRAKPSHISSTVLWQFFGYVYQAVVKVIPTLIILILNIITLIKMRAILKKRKQLRNARQSVCATMLVSPQPVEQTGGNSRTLSVPFVPLNVESTMASEVTSNNPAGERQSSGSNGSRTTRSSKETLKQIKLNGLLITLALCHILTTTWGNVAFILWTGFPKVWANFEGRSTYSTIANSLYVVNYSKNFYLYCLVHEDIRRVAYQKLADANARLRSLFICSNDN